MTRLRLLTSMFLLFSASLLLADDDKTYDESNAMTEHGGGSVADSASIAAEREMLLRISASFEKIKPILIHSCYDCHSNQTQFPWYYKIPGPKQLIDKDIKEACEHLDFSNGFPFAGKGSQVEKLKEMREEIDEGGMPLMIYRIMHWGRMIEGAQKDSVFQWIDSTLILIGNSTGSASDKLRSNLDWYP